MLRRLLVVFAAFAALTATVQVGTASAAEPAAPAGQAQGSPHCPLCVAAGFTAIRVLKAAKAVRQAAKARRIVLAARAAAAAAKSQRAFTATVRATTREARSLSSRSLSSLKRKWPTLRRETQGCLYTSATLSAYKYVRDGMLSFDEYQDWYSRIPLTVFKTDPWPPNVVSFPIFVAKDAVLNDPDEFAVACGIGVALRSKTVGAFPAPK